jgi:hypothetical protein
VTYWLELLRRALAPAAADAFDTFRQTTDARLLTTLIALTATLAGAAVVVFAACDHAARERGLIDRTVNF